MLKLQRYSNVFFKIEGSTNKYPISCGLNSYFLIIYIVRVSDPRYKLEFISFALSVMYGKKVEYLEKVKLAL